MSIRSEQKQLDRALARTDTWIRKELRRVPVPNLAELTPAEAQVAIEAYLVGIMMVIRSARAELHTALQGASTLGAKATARLAEEQLWPQ